MSGVNELIEVGYIGITDKKMETTIVYWGYIGFRV